ncbi:hypothetical protein Hypma_005485 [Hypsizygus marmoreus]|uniref:Uncharacterized protein n=1 Tax=Hypsizygus marmoreus TaxID=39966 RepID=A0A369IZ72_HYPMA|nr:hypothetical protein Hypma_005485 [Hypsizygus marmoreus]
MPLCLTCPCYALKSRPLGADFSRSGSERFLKMKISGELGDVPIIAVFTKFDELVSSQEYDIARIRPSAGLSGDALTKLAASRMKSLQVHPEASIVTAIDAERVNPDVNIDRHPSEVCGSEITSLLSLRRLASHKAHRSKAYCNSDSFGQSSSRILAEFTETSADLMTALQAPDTTFNKDSRELERSLRWEFDATQEEAIGVVTEDASELGISARDDSVERGKTLSLARLYWALPLCNLLAEGAGQLLRGIATSDFRYVLGAAVIANENASILPSTAVSINASDTLHMLCDVVATEHLLGDISLSSSRLRFLSRGPLICLVFSPAHLQLSLSFSLDTEDSPLVF